MKNKARPRTNRRQGLRDSEGYVYIYPEAFHRLQASERNKLLQVCDSCQTDQSSIINYINIYIFFIFL